MEVVLGKVVTTEKFISEVEKLVNNYNLDYMDAIIHYCEKNNLELEAAASIIKSNAKMKAKLQSEGETLNFLPKRAKLPF